MNCQSSFSLKIIESGRASQFILLSLLWCRWDELKVFKLLVECSTPFFCRMAQEQCLTWTRICFYGRIVTHLQGQLTHLSFKNRASNLKQGLSIPPNCCFDFSRLLVALLSWNGAIYFFLTRCPPIYEKSTGLKWRHPESLDRKEVRITWHGTFGRIALF